MFRHRPGRPFVGRTIYLDHAATTPCDPRVVDSMLPWMQHQVANAGQSGHGPGRAAAHAVECARMEVAAALGLHEPSCVLLTSGATEASNLALLGSAEHTSHVVVGATEHPSVLAPARALASRGARVSVVGVDEHGRIRLDELAATVDDGAAVVSVQAVNNETGVVQPLGEIGRIVRRSGATFHVDAVQAFGKVPLDMHAAGIDLLSLSAHKVNGPQGVGALVARDPRILDALSPLHHGGGQERGLRPGTTNVAGAVGLGRAAAIIRMSGEDESLRIRGLRESLEESIRGRLDCASINGSGTTRGPAIASITLDRIDARTLLDDLPELAASTGSACGRGAPSPVLRAMGRSPRQVGGTLRLSIGRTTTPEEVDAAVELIVDGVRRLQAGARTRVRVLGASPAGVA
jgi:cysteine desulfurase